MESVSNALNDHANKLFDHDKRIRYVERFITCMSTAIAVGWWIYDHIIKELLKKG